MRFRPCIDIHNGMVKQIVGGSLKDEGDRASTNFASALDADYYAGLYRKDGLTGGHVILLNPPSSEYYEDTRSQAKKALAAWPQGLQAGGGINPENAGWFLDAGASHVIVTSYVFRQGLVDWDRLKKLKDAVGKERLVLDVSCRRREDGYYIVTDRWQTFTDVRLDAEILEKMAGFCAEFLVHGVDVEGKGAGVEEELVSLLAAWNGCPVTYAGGIGSLEELERFREMTEGKLDFTIGSALDLFGGAIPYAELVKMSRL